MKPAQTLDEALADAAYHQAHFETLLEKEIDVAMDRIYLEQVGDDLAYEQSPATPLITGEDKCQ